MLKESLLYASIGELARQIESKQLSPVELTESYLERSEKLGPHLNAYARLTTAVALEQAQLAEKEIRRGHYRGPLHGIPYAAKDLLAVKGIPTTWGAKPYAEQVFDTNAAVIEHLKNVGAVMLGKAAMIELAGGMGYTFASASLQGETRNPWNTTCWTCGSSSGSGAIVAAGLAAFAIGTETWGSIVCPSAFCGISGRRPAIAPAPHRLAHQRMERSRSWRQKSPRCRPQGFAAAFSFCSSGFAAGRSVGRCGQRRLVVRSKFRIFRSDPFRPR